MSLAKIKPTLNFKDLVFIVIGLVIGMGIFRTPAVVAKTSESSFIFYSAWIAGGIVSLIGAFIFAEIGSRNPSIGGFYQLFSVSYNPIFAFMVNWITVVSNAASSALVAIIGGEYLAPLLFPNNAQAPILIAVVCTLFLFIANWRGMKFGSTLLNGLMIFKIGLIALIISALFFVPSFHGTEAIVIAEKQPNWYLFLLCFPSVFFTYGGYQQTMNFGGDVQNARRIMPKAIILGMLVVLVLYLLVCFAFENILGFHQLAETKTPAADVMKMLMGENAQMVLSVAMFLGVMAYVNVSLMSNPRVYYAMSKDGVLPQIFGRVNEKTQTQEVSLILFTLIILITYYFSSSVEALLEYVMFFDSIAFITAAASIFIFRSREAKNNLKYDGFKMWGYPVLPILFILIYASIVTSIFMSNAFTAFVGLGLFLLGLPLYYFLRRIISSAENEK